ncbi:Sulfotransferase family cytosolic 1B member 1 [Armadillidium nasatum]|uniref:Sulfotransferase family cytosolic 1B member 1 n=1 Tax=Armadillidium nasatum TaxID=96803 RepID=A0A5N5T8R4_9CRUS|nr:Sulfotransferase family cytosolic 1B member 1 [Armadillidium nasatum]
MKIEIYNGPLKDLINKTFGVFSKMVQAGDDKTILCTRYELWYEKYFAFETRPSDTWVLSFPKTGTTWTQEMVWCILNDLESKEAEQFFDEKIPLLRMGLSSS